MWVSVLSTPGTLFSASATTAAIWSWSATRISAIRSMAPVTEYTSLTPLSAAIASATSGMRATSALMNTIAVTMALILVAAGSLDAGVDHLAQPREHLHVARQVDRAEGRTAPEPAVEVARRRADRRRGREAGVLLGDDEGPSGLRHPLLGGALVAGEGHEPAGAGVAGRQAHGRRGVGHHL